MALVRWEPICRYRKRTGNLGHMTAGKPESERIPENFGPYKVLERLGAGAMGAVYRAHDPGLNREVALKVVTSSSSNAGKRFKREARLALRLFA